MSKKTQPKSSEQKAEELVRDQNGYGSLPAFDEFVVPAEGFAPGAIVNGQEVHIVNMEEDPAAADLAVDEVHAWNPTGPEGDGWTLAIVADSDAGPWALWARPAAEKPLEGCAYAEQFLLGSLIKACTRHLKTLSKPWHEMKEGEQQNVMHRVHVDCREAVTNAIDLISGNARLTFRAEVEQVVFKDGVKATLKLAKTSEAHSLADAEGSFVTVVIEERSTLLQEGDSLTVDPDQKPLFDASTAGTQIETEKTVLKAA